MLKRWHLRTHPKLNLTDSVHLDPVLDDIHTFIPWRPESENQILQGHSTEMVTANPEQENENSEGKTAVVHCRVRHGSLDKLYGDLVGVVASI